MENEMTIEFVELLRKYSTQKGGYRKKHMKTCNCGNRFIESNGSRYFI